MTLRLFGAVLIIVGCAGFGFMIAANHRREEKTLRRLISALEFMECELQYRLTPLPELCRLAGASAGGILRRVLNLLAEELEQQISPDVDRCMQSTLSKVHDVPQLSYAVLQKFGRTLGRFDVKGQLRGIESVREESIRVLENYTKNQDARLRSYQTLGLCAGAAMAILFI